MDWVRGAAYEPKITQMGTISDHDRISGRHFELGLGNQQADTTGTCPQILDAIAYMYAEIVPDRNLQI